VFLWISEKLKHGLATMLFVALVWPVGQARAETINIDSPISPLAKPASLDAGKVALGRKLFFEPRLSSDNSISCAHCHDLAQGGGDGLKFSFGVNGAEGGMNSPTVYNAGLNVAQFWDGRASSLEEQVNGPTHNPVEMNSDWKTIITKLKNDSEYNRLFDSLYQQGINADNIRDAIATFERSLVAINSPFDRYLQGDDSAITPKQKQGYDLFVDYGCTSCHQGANVGSNMFEVLGVFDDYFRKRGHINNNDFGRFNVTGNEEDKYKFKVPSLRLVTLTAPYFHDGSVGTLDEAVQKMAYFQLGRRIPKADVDAIIAFLESLVGELDSQTP